MFSVGKDSVMIGKSRLLVVDDEADMLQGLRKSLTREGYSVDIAKDGMEAVEKIEVSSYDVVISDLKLPRLDGIGLLERARDIRPQAVFIIITGYGSIESAVKALKLGAFDYITKPFSTQKISEVTAKAIQEKKAWSATATLPEEAIDVIEGYCMPLSLYYHPEHSWGRVEEDGTVRVGADDVFQKRAGEIIHIDFPFEGEEVARGKVCVRVTNSERKIHKLVAPVSGRVVDVNSALVSDHSLVKHDPYGTGWMLRIAPQNLKSDLAVLLFGRPLVEWWMKHEASDEKENKYLMSGALDPNFKNEIAAQPGGESIKACFACGSCSASCPIAEIDERYNPRRIIRMALLGMKEEVLTSDFVWLCASCYSCQERCPQGVKITDLMVALKNCAAKSGYVHPGIAAQAKPICRDGRIYAIDDFDNKKREKLGLPPVQSRAENVEKIFQITGADKVIKGGQ